MKATLEDFFEELYGFRPKKKGQAHEMLAAAVCKLLTEITQPLKSSPEKGVDRE